MVSQRVTKSNSYDGSQFDEPQPKSSLAEVEPDYDSGETVSNVDEDLLIPDSPSQEQTQRTLTINDALSFVNQVKFTFKDQPAIYQQFLAIMKFPRAEPLPVTTVLEVRAHIKHLFADYPELINAFNRFLPVDFKIVNAHH